SPQPTPPPSHNSEGGEAPPATSRTCPARTDWASRSTKHKSPEAGGRFPRLRVLPRGQPMRWGVVVPAVLVLLAGLSPGRADPAGASPPNRLPRSDQQPPTMQFERVREGGDCRDHCRIWIAASGRISETTAADFEAFVRDLDVKNTTVALDSGGGVVEDGLALGRVFRRLGLTTTVGGIVRLAPDASGARRAALSPRATCASMCVFALLGGVRRHVPDEAHVLVHQIWPGKQREDALAATYSAGNMMRIQRELGVVGRYTGG